MQYGFSQDRGCQKALLSVECIVNYFTSRGSPVYMAALDASKAFDKVNHYSLFISIMNIKIPLPHLRIIVYWHLHLKGSVRWNGCFSYIFDIKSGIRQGGINSPGFFNVFINDLIVKLRYTAVQSKKGVSFRAIKNFHFEKNKKLCFSVFLKHFLRCFALNHMKFYTFNKSLLSI